MTRTLSVAALQTSYGEDMAANIAKTERLIRDAAKRGAQVIFASELFQGPYFCTTQKSAGSRPPFRGDPSVRHRTCPGGEGIGRGDSGFDLRA